jgi:hypothetical protein
VINATVFNQQPAHASALCSLDGFVRAKVGKWKNEVAKQGEAGRSRAKVLSKSSYVESRKRYSGEVSSLPTERQHKALLSLHTHVLTELALVFNTVRSSS